MLPKWSPNGAQMASKIDPEPDLHENLKTLIMATFNLLEPCRPVQNHSFWEPRASRKRSKKHLYKKLSKIALRKRIYLGL